MQIHNIYWHSYRLHKSLVEHLNAEVVLQTIANIGDAVAWLSNTFLNVRISKNPGHYGEYCFRLLSLFDISTDSS